MVEKSEQQKAREYLETLATGKIAGPIFREVISQMEKEVGEISVYPEDYYNWGLGPEKEGRRKLSDVEYWELALTLQIGDHSLANFQMYRLIKIASGGKYIWERGFGSNGRIKLRRVDR